MNYFDISPVLKPELAVFPGDQGFERNTSLSFESGDNLTLSSLRSTLHLGSHLDAPSHYHPEGITIEQLDLIAVDVRVKPLGCYLRCSPSVPQSKRNRSKIEMNEQNET